MNVNEMQTAIRAVTDNEFGLEAFSVLKNDNELSLAKFLLNDELCGKVKGLLVGVLNSRYLGEETELDEIENIADNRKVFYEIPQSEEYKPFSFLSTYADVTAIYKEEIVDQLFGFAFRFSVNDTSFWIYQQISYPQLIKRSTNLYAILYRGNIYSPLKKDVLKIEGKADCLIIGNSIITSKIDLMQRFFQFEVYVRREAGKTIELISAMEIVDNLDKFIAVGAQKALTNAKKLVKAKHSPVLRMDKETLLHKLNTLPRYKDKFDITDGKIVISNQKQAVEFIKMLNDSILKSELTDAEYDSTVKIELAPME